MDYLSVDVCKRLQKISCCPEPIRWWAHWPDGKGWGVIILPTSDAIPIPHPSDVLEELGHQHPDWLIDQNGCNESLTITISTIPPSPDLDGEELVTVSDLSWFIAMERSIREVLSLLE